MEKVLFEGLLNIMKRLRGEGGCPWDRAQTIESLKPFLIEECYEVINAIEDGDPSKIQEELGDLLYQIVFLAQIGQEEGSFDIAKILNTITKKMIRRHPHVFSNDSAKDAQEVLLKWEKIKKAEQQRGREEIKDASILDGIPKGLPGIIFAHRVQDKASRVGFDWERIGEVLEKLDEELREFKEALDREEKERIESEFGDILFTMINVARFLGIEPDGALRKSTVKFVKRFKLMEEMIYAKGEIFKDLSSQELDRYWERAKKAIS